LRNANRETSPPTAGVMPLLLGVAMLALALGPVVWLIACATPHQPTRVLPHSPQTQSSIETPADTGYVYDQLLFNEDGITLKEGKIAAVTPAWARKALARVLDLQEALDECQAERRALLH
jgi:hypothetical protein